MSLVRPDLRYPVIIILFLFLVASLLTKVFTAPPAGAGAVMWADYPGLVEVQNRAFKQLIDDTLACDHLSLHTKKPEVDTAELVALVRLSDLHSKDSLAESLRRVMHNSHRFLSKLNEAIDSTMATNDFALNAIYSARGKKAMNKQVKETFADAMDVTSTHLKRLIVEYDANDSELSTLRYIVEHEKKDIAEVKEDLLADLWTKMGGNKKDLRNFDRNLKVLQALTVYHKHASAHIAVALHTLQSVSQDMEAMKERVAAPNRAGAEIAPEAHVKSIKNGLERLRAERSRARKIGEEVLKRALEVDKIWFGSNL